MLQVSWLVEDENESLVHNTEEEVHTLAVNETLKNCTSGKYINPPVEEL
jgi:hypothetical protein